MFSAHLAALVERLGEACLETARVAVAAQGPQEARTAQTLRESAVYLLERAEHALSLAENGPAADRRAPTGV